MKQGFIGEMKMAEKNLTLVQKKSALKLAYKVQGWVDNIDNMSNKQVYAIFDKLRSDGIISYDDNANMYFKTKEEVQKLKEARQGFHQITLDEYLKENEKEK